MNISDLSVSQLQRAVALKKQVEKLQKQLASILGTSMSADGMPKRRGMSAAGRARIAAAQKARWAKSRKSKGRSKPRRKLSAAARKQLSQNAKARWAKARAAGRKRL